MLAERVGRFKDWLKYKLDWDREARRFHLFFPYMTEPNGILTKPGEEISPILRGFITARGSFGIMSKIIKGKELSDKERRSVREATWLTSLTGTYAFNSATESGVEVKISVEDDECSNYLAENANKDTVIGFLSYRDDKTHFRHKESSSVRVLEEDGNSSIVFSFPQVTEVPTQNPELYVYTRPAENNKINEKFIRLNLLLGLQN